MSIDYSKCSICHEKDHTQNMLMPCKCQRWVHRSCLDKKRVSDIKYYDSCPLCNTSYRLDKKRVNKWRKHFEIIGSIVLDLILFVLLFIACSKLLGSFLVRIGINSPSERIPNPTLFGAIVLLGILGFISFIVGIVFIFTEDIPIIYIAPNCNEDNMLVVFVIIGIIVLVSATIYVVYIVGKQRYERHQRSFGVKVNVVNDYLRGVEII